MLAATHEEDIESSPATLRVPFVVIPPEAKREREREEESPFLAVTVRSVEVATSVSREGRRAVAVIWSMAFVALGLMSALFLWGR